MEERSVYGVDGRGRLFYNRRYYQRTGELFRPLEIVDGQVVVVDSSLADSIKRHRERVIEDVDVAANRQLRLEIGKSPQV